MKRLLVLMLVLGFASMATAQLALWVNGSPATSSSIDMLASDTIYIEVYSDGTISQSIAYISIAAGPGSWTGGNGFYQPPSIPGGAAYNYYYGYITGFGDTWMMINADATTNVLGVGILADYEFHCDDLGDVTITLFDNVLGLQDTLIIHQIPEPMTIGLLGLGGLFLRRRK